MAVRLQAEGFSISQTADGNTHRQEDGEHLKKCTTADVRDDSDVVLLFGRELVFYRLDRLFGKIKRQQVGYTTEVLFSLILEF